MRKRTNFLKDVSAPTHLLDTVTLVWMADSPRFLSRTAFNICCDRQLNPAVSVFSLVELIVKTQKGKLRLDPDPLEWWKQNLKLLGYFILPIRQNHVEKLWTLPLLHKDPADRLLIAQALAEGIPLITPDEAIREYPVETIW